MAVVQPSGIRASQLRNRGAPRRYEGVGSTSSSLTLLALRTNPKRLVMLTIVR